MTTAYEMHPKFNRKASSKKVFVSDLFRVITEFIEFHTDTKLFEVYLNTLSDFKNATVGFY